MSLLRRIQGSQSPPATSPSPQPARPGPPPEPPPPSAPRRPLPVTAGLRDAYADLKSRIQSKLLAELEPTLDLSRTEELRTMIEEKFDAVLAEDHIVLSRLERQRLFEQILAEILGYGPLQPLLQDDAITEIMVNGPKKVYVERGGKIERTNVVFEDNEHLMRIIERIVAPLGRRVDESTPYVDARLPDGSRVNIVIPPISLIGPVVTIRKFYRNPLTVDDLIRLGSTTPEAMEFLKACVQAKINIVVAGGTGSGKTTLLNILSGFIPEGERIVTIENAAELQLRQEHVVTLETRPPNIEGKGEITMRDLVINALRMRPDRIIVGECRGGEAFDMLQAMNTGHEGSMTTIHANTPRDALARLENMVLMAGTDLPHRAIREQISMAIDLIVQTARLRDGSRRILSITEVQHMEGEVITTTDLFEFEQYGMEGGKIVGRLVPRGLRPRFNDRLEAAGIRLPPSIFGIGRR